MNKYFDKEYATQWAYEQLYLKESGIRYTFVKAENGITTWKYEKNSILFDALFKFYRMIESKNHVTKKKNNIDGE